MVADEPGFDGIGGAGVGGGVVEDELEFDGIGGAGVGGGVVEGGPGVHGIYGAGGIASPHCQVGGTNHSI